MSHPFNAYGFQLALIAILCLANYQSPLSAQDQNWPQFRGAESNPIGPFAKLPDRWSLTDKQNIEWSFQDPGRGWSSPVVWGDKVFLTTVVSNKEYKEAQVGADYSNQYAAELAEQGLSEEEIMKKLLERDFEMPDDSTSLSYRLYCLDLNSGKENWHVEYHSGRPPCGRHRKNSFASETPTTDGERVYIYIANLGVFAYDFSGDLIWKNELPNRPIYLDFGTGSSPILVDDRLIVLNDNEEASELLAFNKKDGALCWRVERGKFPEGQRPIQASGWTTPYLWKNSQRTEIITIGPGRLVSYNLDGKELWHLNGLRPGPASSPFAVGDHLIVNGGPPSPIYSIAPGAEGDITPPKRAAGAGAGEEARPDSKPHWVRWIYPRSMAYIPTPLVYQGGLYVLSDNGILTRLDLETGVESFKKRIKSSGADFTASPWAYDGKIFVASEQGDIFVFASGPEFQLLHVNPVGEMMMASPALVKDRVLLRTQRQLLSIRKTL
jgi:outer membrane protein assembly factor BamB